MKTAVINIKTDASVKRKAQRLAQELGFSLSALINAYLRDIIRTKSINFSLSEEPSDYLLRVLEESERDRKDGKIVSFDEPQKALDYLKKLAGNEEE